MAHETRERGEGKKGMWEENPLVRFRPSDGQKTRTEKNGLKLKLASV